MTIIYTKRTGLIKSIFSGNLQKMDSLYGDDAQDLKIIWDEIIIPDDNNVINTPQNFKVNIDTKQLEILEQPINEYPIASQ
ncbi:hypothetical protein [Clostridium sp.]|uniref:hypothetical protein n=1 Tax=Clostridium sp. TaxID=1506 RepID=UPI001A4163E8|nr:hypothetical protein [Clostridium sp.]MBK5243048.1 hypothetical protein [Clostridium sp.]